MKKKIIAVLPFIIMPVFIPIYNVLDSIILVDIFGCGCVPFSQTNMLNIPFNANDLRKIVFLILTIILFIWSMIISKTFDGKSTRRLYCFAVIILNLILTVWVVKTFMWG